MLRLRECLDIYTAGGMTLNDLVNDAESLIGLLAGNGDQEWLAELEAESILLEHVNSGGPIGRTLTEREAEQVTDSIANLRLLTDRYW